MDTHLSDEQASRLLDGTLPGEDLRPLESHLWRCPACRDALRRRTEPAEGLPPLPAPGLPDDATPVIPLHEGLGLAALLTAAVLAARSLPRTLAATVTGGLEHRATPVAIGVITALAFCWVAGGSLDVEPLSTDEASYVLQAGLLAEGKVTAPGAPIPEFFEQPWVLVTPRPLPPRSCRCSRILQVGTASVRRRESAPLISITGAPCDGWKRCTRSCCHEDAVTNNLPPAVPR